MKGKPKLKAVVFDLDNTLYDYDAAHAPAFEALTRFACREFGLTPEEFAEGDYLRGFDVPIEYLRFAQMAGKALVSTGLAMETTLSTPASQLTGALSSFGVPNLVILTVDLALRSIVRLGEVALEALNALTLRSVGRNRNKQTSMGGIGGVVLIKAGEAAQATHDAMRCRGFEGDYHVARHQALRAIDWAWTILLLLLAVLFVYLQGLV